ncbi:hypothetical protein K502DRAFT_330198 [Neoconidiobolus thromboides FSU 785]|nr:hypothetical protein K502DRAFT_330198 [Neoconidiobolus thromboides FSU 785]
MKSFIAILISFLAIASALNLPESNNATSSQGVTAKGYGYETNPSINSKCHQVNESKSSKTPGQSGEPGESDQSGQLGKSGELDQSSQSSQPEESGESGQSGYY